MVFLDKLANEYAEIRFANTNSKRILVIGIYVHAFLCKNTALIVISYRILVI